MLNVAERGACVATFRWIEVRCMETLAAWVPTTPEMEAKLLFGAHIWDAAQHADILGRRTHELRLPLQHSVEPASSYVAFMDGMLGIRSTARRIAAFYDCALPGLRRRFQAYLQQVDPLLDGPTVRLLERIMFDMDRMSREKDALLREMPAFAIDDVADMPWLQNLMQQEAARMDIVLHARLPEPAQA